MGGSSGGHKGGVLGAVPLKRKTPGVFGSRSVRCLFGVLCGGVCVRAGMSASVCWRFGVVLAGLGGWAVWGFCFSRLVGVSCVLYLPEIPFAVLFSSLIVIVIMDTFVPLINIPDALFL